MFWGLIMEPNKRYTQVVEKPFHISQAAMDIATGDNDPCQVMVLVEGKNFLVCTLQKNKTIQVPLDLYFKTGESVAFLTNGKSNIHLTGYLDPEFEEEVSDEEDEEEEEEEVPALVPAKTKTKRKLDNSNEGAAKKKAKPDKKTAKAESSDSEDEDEDQLQKLLDGDVDSDEEDESFKVNTSAEADNSDEEESDSDEEEEAEAGEEAEDDSDEEEQNSSQADSTLDSSKEADLSKLSKSARRRLKKKLAQQKKQTQVNGIDKPKKEKGGGDAPQQKAEKKKQEVKKEEVKEKGDQKEKKALSGGVFIEDLKVGEGSAAKPGKTVMVYYEGRLKQNNKMFDNCKKGAGFKFRLGAKEVISGWDVGISGMKVGGKRKIVCPPNMAYGAKGSPPVIPPNSTLVFEVELKEVK